MKQSEKKTQCPKCLRNKKGICMAFKKKQWPCWAYIDNKGEFDQQEKERDEYCKRCGIT